MILIGQKIKKIRRLKGFRQADMAKKLRISQAAYSRLEKEEVKINIETLVKVSKVFKMKIEDVLRFDEKISYIINNKEKGQAANVTMNYGKINDFETLKRLLIQIDKKFERQRKEIEFLKKKIKTS